MSHPWNIETPFETRELLTFMQILKVPNIDKFEEFQVPKETEELQVAQLIPVRASECSIQAFCFWMTFKPS